MLRILAYHRVAELRDTPAVDSRGVSATPDGFARQMKHLARFYRVVSMPEVLEAVEKGRPLPKRAVLITFDDAYADFAEIAWPILKQLRLPATMFVPTAYPDQPERAFWSDALYQAFAATSRKEIHVPGFGRLPLGAQVDGKSKKQIPRFARDDIFRGARWNRDDTFPEQWRRSLRAVQDHVTRIPHNEAMRLVDSVCAELGLSCTQGGSVLTWKQLRELAREGLTLGSHTRTHAIMTKITSEQMHEEVRGSQEDLQREIGACLPIFCYPNGNHNETVVSILREQGVRLAFTTLSGLNNLDSLDPLRLRRTVIMPRTTPAIFCLRLLRLGIQLDAWRERKQMEVLTRGLPEYRTGHV